LHLNKLGDLRFLGRDLVRPECVLAHRSGCLFAPDWSGNGGIAVIGPSGDVRKILAKDVAEPLRPNGIALECCGTVLMAHLGAGTGGVFRMDAQGYVEPVLTELDGHALPPTNFPYLDHEGRLWVTVSTRKRPRALGYRPDVADGFILALEKGRTRIVADGLGYTNECLVSPDGGTLYVNETFARRLTAFSVHADGSLSDRRVIVNFGPGTFPDGLTLDEEGGLWVTSIVSNRVIRVIDGRSGVMLEDVDDTHLDDVEAAFQAGQMGRPHLDQVKSRLLRNISNLSFGGPGRRTIYLGCLLGESIATLAAPLPGAAPSHWDIGLGALIENI
jgi:sugar lactone lactonase YvrE